MEEQELARCIVFPVPSLPSLVTLFKFKFGSFLFFSPKYTSHLTVGNSKTIQWSQTWIQVLSLITSWEILDESQSFGFLRCR